MMSMIRSTYGFKIAFQLVHHSCTAVNLNGYAKFAWDRLKSKYKPSTAPRYMRSEKILVNCKLPSNNSPDIWMTYIEQLVCKMNNCIVAGRFVKTNTDIILHMLCHLPEQYEGMVQELSTKLEENTAA